MFNDVLTKTAGELFQSQTCLKWTEFWYETETIWSKNKKIMNVSGQLRLWWELDTRDKQWPNHLGLNSRLSIKNNALENRDTAEAFYISHWTLLLYLWKPNLFAHQQFQWHHKRVERGTEFHHICVPWLAGCIFVHWWLALNFIWLQFLTSTVCDITAISSPSSVLLTVCSVAVSTARCLCLTTKSAL